MKKTSVIALLLSVAILLGLFTCFAHEDEDHHHDEHMRNVLFGSKTFAPGSKQDKCVKALEAASYLCLDQDNGHGADSLAVLKAFKVKKLPKNISDIDFAGNYSHRMYTHMGWWRGYRGTEDKANWNVRKIILTETVKEIFGFKDTELADSFAAVVYYVHILSDHMHMKKYSDENYTISFAYAHRGPENRDIIYELLYYIPLILPSGKTGGSYQYSSLMSQLQTIGAKASQLIGAPGGIQTAEQLEEYTGYAEDVMKLLKSYLPGLLQNEAYFAKVF